MITETIAIGFGMDLDQINDLEIDRDRYLEEELALARLSTNQSTSQRLLADSGPAAPDDDEDEDAPQDAEQEDPQGRSSSSQSASQSRGHSGSKLLVNNGGQSVQSGLLRSTAGVASANYPVDEYQEDAAAYLETHVFPTLFQGIERLLKTVKKKDGGLDEELDPLQWLGVFLYKYNPAPSGDRQHLEQFASMYPIPELTGVPAPAPTGTAQVVAPK
ncbi:uncharacterized protein BJ171DRAFT_627332 [Polychytrium aggregatum]|uniref:uncharacterized protein n=1 Tax=Polychytrium aggregatum TaxID=110093 RepID=UPI0022FDF2C6|nr:uncharacterized protein BJ171DRAFT_627332 [Polychytrium aggregatum]KAI9209125.1 hypothetical protein BJ171DRAFT_627332 [Polychytrium aggregatum]